MCGLGLNINDSEYSKLANHWTFQRIHALNTTVALARIFPGGHWGPCIFVGGGGALTF